MQSELQDCLNDLGATFKRLKHSEAALTAVARSLSAVPIVGRVPAQDIDAASDGYSPGISRAILTLTDAKVADVLTSLRQRRAGA